MWSYLVKKHKQIGKGDVIFAKPEKLNENHKTLMSIYPRKAKKVKKVKASKANKSEQVKTPKAKRAKGVSSRTLSVHVDAAVVNTVAKTGVAKGCY